jgi:hypothetical protein
MDQSTCLREEKIGFQGPKFNADDDNDDDKYLNTQE